MMSAILAEVVEEIMTIKHRLTTKWLHEILSEITLLSVSVH
jgi:hypothetical protein